MAFDCPHCGFRSNELQQANAIAEGGAIYKCHVTTKADLNRQLVKTNTAVVKIPEIDFEIPAQRGHLTTIEGLLQTVISDLESDQPVRRVRTSWSIMNHLRRRLQNAAVTLENQKRMVNFQLSSVFFCHGY
jgi:C4-type Zn-finger protein